MYVPSHFAADDAAVRELLEETGLRLPDGTLRLWYDGHDTPEPKARPGLLNHWQIWVARVDLTDDDIVVGEGRQIVFVDPDDVAGLDLAPAPAHYVPRFLASGTYRDLSAGRSPSGPPGQGS